MGRFLRFGLMGCGAFVVLTFVIVAAVLVFGGGGTETAGSDPGGPTAPEEPGEPEQAAPEEPEQAAAPPPEEKPPESVIVRVTGDPGIRFSGDIGTMEGSQTVQGTVPQDFPVEVKRGFLEMDSVSALAQNLYGSGTLTVQILEGDEVRKESTTTAQYGVASTTWVPGEQ